MATDFRTIERLLEDFFRSHGVSGSRGRGDLYLGVCSTEVDNLRSDDGRESEGCEVRVCDEFSTDVVSLTDLAREIAEVFR